MRFSNLLVIAAATALVTAEQGLYNGVDEISTRANQPKAVLLEFDKVYTEEDLHLLQTGSTSNHQDVSSKRLSRDIFKRDGVNYMRYTARFQCPVYGSVGVTIKGQVALRRGRNVDNTATWTAQEHIDSWSFGDRTSFGINEPRTSNTARYNFCLSFETTICSYRFAVEWHAFFRGDYNHVGFDTDIPSLQEVCATVRGRNTCPSLDVSQSQGCQVQTTRKDIGTG